MREIKFRGICKNTGKFFYGGYAENTITAHGMIASNAIMPSGCYGVEVIPETIGQYTGLKDANGVEIYEGDIIKSNSYPFYGDALDGRFNDLNYLGSVGIDPDGCYYDLHVVSDRVRGAACGGNLSEINEVCEVIGNIHENTELLK